MSSKNTIQTENDNEWVISSSGFSKEDILFNGSRMLIGNGYMGYRGTKDEASKDEITSLIINGVYDKYEGGWREPVNFPNPLSMRVFHNDQMSYLKTDNDLQFHDQRLNFRYGLYTRKSTWKKETVIIHIASERFASMNNPHLLCQKYYLSSDQQCHVTVLSGIDSSVHDIYGPHFTIINNKNYVDTNTGGRGMIRVKNTLGGKTLENSEPWCLSKLLECSTSTNISATAEEVLHEGISGVKFTCDLNPGQVVEFIVYAAVYTGLDFTGEKDQKYNECMKAAEDELNKAADEGYEKLYLLHKQKWDTLWNDGDVVIKGDAEAQKSLRFSLYHLHSIAPRTKRVLSIPARGLSGQTYKGAVFWDTELFILPYFLFTEPETAKKLIQYRISTLDGARRKASLYGYKGAFYAWESQDTGDDVCSDYNVIDVFTRRPMRTYFKDKQIHISSAIVYAIQEYIKISGDTKILYKGAFEVILECARFYASRCVYIPLRDRYEILDVLGPDEYHERVNNNAYTNRMALFTIDTALNYIEKIQKENDIALQSIINTLSFVDEIALMKDVSSKLYVPSFTDKSVERLTSQQSVIPQFDGYFSLEDCELDVLKERLIDPNEYWGGSCGIASETQIIKQADSIILMNLFPDECSLDIKRSNYLYYVQRTEHGSSLSACMYALLACQLENPSEAYQFFRKTAEIDLCGGGKQYAGLVYIGGTHPAANGGAWLSVVQGFCGFKVLDGQIQLQPALPKHWEEVSFKVTVRGQRYEIFVSQKGNKICRI